ncbi:ATP-binding cassette transporter CGR1 [Rhodotorula toruloides]
MLSLRTSSRSLAQSIAAPASRRAVSSLVANPAVRPSLLSSARSSASHRTQTALTAAMGATRLSHHSGESTVRPPADKVMQDIADYVHNYEIKSDLAYSTARLCLIDTIGCGLEGLRVSEECRALMEPIVPGTTVPNGTKVPGTPFQMDPVRGAFAIGTQIRWLDFNDCSCFLAAEWGHPSDNLGAILAVADYLSRSGEPLKMRDVLTAMIKAHEIQGCMALENSFNRVGLDHVILVKLASAAVVSQMLGLTRDQTVDVISQVFVDGQSLRTFRHAPNTGSRKSWSAGDACMRAVHLALQVKRGQMGIPTVLTAKTWGFYDVLFKGQEFKFQRPYGSYIMENVLFKISFPAEFHAQTAAEGAHILHKQLKEMGKSSDDIKSVKIRTQEAAIRIIDKSGPLDNFADRDHCIQYMVAVPLIYGRLTTEDYSDKVAADPRIDALRDKMYCVEDKQFTSDYHSPDKRYISNGLTVTLNDGTVLPEVHIDFPVGHKNRREEGTPLLNAKFERHIKPHFDSAHVDKILEVVGDQSALENLSVKEFSDLFHKP